MGHTFSSIMSYQMKMMLWRQKVAKVKGGKIANFSLVSNRLYNWFSNYVQYDAVTCVTVPDIVEAIKTWGHEDMGAKGKPSYRNKLLVWLFLIQFIYWPIFESSWKLSTTMKLLTSTTLAPNLGNYLRRKTFMSLLLAQTNIYLFTVTQISIPVFGIFSMFAA